ncbi:hypothetical protein [Variovorax sp. dw_308]|uniref:hypothetical protein n=1 Tax=Variovorax sp. dw_308 TaxID=2721546 RepID=UPI001C495CE2|nr:hypothetical protein [Variovorax sp. dw_308]
MYSRYARVVVLLGAVLAVSACDRNAPAVPAPKADSAPLPGAAASEIKPHTGGELPASAAPAGPAEGTTAIGGMTGGKQDGGAAKGGAPESTGGDGTNAKP